MRHDREPHARGPRPRTGEDPGMTGEYGSAPEAPFPETSEGSSPAGSAPEAGESTATEGGLREDESEWGGGYVGGREYGGTNYDLHHGYALGRDPLGPRSSGSSRRGRGGAGGRDLTWGEPEPPDEYGPARYGYGPYYDRLQRRRRSDEEIRKEVEDALFFDTWVDADAISVFVQDGVVTLSGILPSFEELRYAVDDAWDVDGVRGVRSELDVDESGTGRRARGRRQAGSEQGAAGTPAGTGERDARSPWDVRLGDPEWRRHLHGHPEAGSSHAPGAAQEAASKPAAARSRGRSSAAAAETSSSRSRGERGERAERAEEGGRGGRSGGAPTGSGPRAPRTSGRKRSARDAKGASRTEPGTPGDVGESGAAEGGADRPA